MERLGEQSHQGFGHKLLTAIKEHRRQARIERMSQVWENGRVRPVEFGGATSGPGDEAFEAFGKALKLSEEDIAEAYVIAHDRVAAELNRVTEE